MSSNIILFQILAIVFRLSHAALLPQFVVEPQSAILKIGSPHQLSCLPHPGNVSVRWIFNGAVLPQGKKGAIEIQGGNLTFLSFNASDEGLYQCMAITGFGSFVSNEAKVEAAAFAPSDGTINISRFSVWEGNTAVIPCSTPSSKPAALIEYEMNGTKLFLTKRHMILPSGNLQIFNVSRSDQGTYRCVASNPVIGNRMRSNSTHKLNIVASEAKTAPVVVSTPYEQVVVNQGSNLTLECVAKGLPVPEVTWEKYGGHLVLSRCTQVLGNLIIREIQKFDAGTYLCKATNGVNGMQTKIVSVNVLETPVIETASSEQIATQGSTVVFKCRAHGTPKVTTQWLFNGTPLTIGQFIDIRETSLTLSNVQLRQAGIYQCVGKNSLGTARTLARLIVTKSSRTETNTADADFDEEEEDEDGYSSDGSDEEIQPEKISGRDSAQKSNSRKGPEEGNAKETSSPFSKLRVTVQSKNSVHVQWNFEPSAGPALVSFKLQYRDISEGQKWETVHDSISPTMRFFDVLGLISGKVYRFRIGATYANRECIYSPESTRISLTPSNSRSSLPAPVIVEAKPLSSSEIFIGWRQQDTDNWLVDGFEIHYAPFEDKSNVQKMTVPGTMVRHAVLSHLLPGLSYSFRLQSFTETGIRSNFSNSVVKTTLAESVNELPTKDHVDKDMLPEQDELEATKQQDHSIGGARDEKLTYIIVGIILVIMSIVVIVWATVCIWKKQQKKSNEKAKASASIEGQSSAFLAFNAVRQDQNTRHIPSCGGGCNTSGLYGISNACLASDVNLDTRNFSQGATSNRYMAKKFPPDLLLPRPPPSDGESVYDTVDIEDCPEDYFVTLRGSNYQQSPIYSQVPDLDRFPVDKYKFQPQPLAPRCSNPTSNPDLAQTPFEHHAYWVLEENNCLTYPKNNDHSLKPDHLRHGSLSSFCTPTSANKQFRPSVIYPHEYELCPTRTEVNDELVTPNSEEKSASHMNSIDNSRDLWQTACGQKNNVATGGNRGDVRYPSINSNSLVEQQRRYLLSNHESDLSGSGGQLTNVSNVRTFTG